MNGNNDGSGKIDSVAEPQRLSSHELPVIPKLPVPLSLCVSELPMSNGQGPETVLKALAAQNACTRAANASKRLFKLVRDLRAIEEGTGRELEIANLMIAFNEWHRRSQAFLDPAKTREHYPTEFLAGFRKVRVPTSKGDTINKALEVVLKLPVSKLPEISGIPDAPESLCRLAALHREISRLTGGNTHFLSCRDAAKACPGLSYQLPNEINRALE